MRKDTKPTDEQFKALYQVADAFKQTQPWKWLFDGDIICVENPKDKMMGYCSVMGRGGEHYALAVYLENKGFLGLHQMIEHSDSIPPHQLLHYQDCLMCSFEDRDILANEDRKQIKDMGLSFRGRNAWPLFRRYEPGFEPWFINEEECLFLTHSLKQVLFVAENILTGQHKIDMQQGRTVERYSEEKDGKLEWRSDVVQLTLPKAMYIPVIITDDMLIQRIKKAGNREDVTLQVDTCYVLAPVQENRGERPYFPKIFIIAEQKSGQILDFEMYQNSADDASVTLSKLMGMLLEKGVPKEIQVRSEMMTALLDDFCKKTGILLKRVKKLRTIDQLMKGMARHY